MQGTAVTEVEELIRAARGGDVRSERELWALLYGELHRLAHARRAVLHDLETLQTTALVHEAYLKLVRAPRRDFETLGAFYVAAARAMRNLLVDAIRRNAGRARPDEIDGCAASTERERECLAVNAALAKLERVDPALAQLVDLRYFAGLSVERTCQVLHMSPATYHRRWNHARGWLLRELSELRRA